GGRGFACHGVRAAVVREGGRAQVARPRHRLRPAPAGIRRTRWCASARARRPRIGRCRPVAPGRVHPRTGIPGHTRLAAGVGAAEAAIRGRGFRRSYNGGMDESAELEAGLQVLGLDRAHAPALLAYLSLLARLNKAYNLTAMRDPREMVSRHLLDSLAMHASLDAIAEAGGSLADLGTGAGLPGIPLAIVKPGLQVSLVESNGKKARFMREALRTLGLGNARVVESRIETFDAPGMFDAVTARALATLPLILELGGHLLKPGGLLLAMKGVVPEAEIAALPAGWRVRDVRPLTVPGLAAERHLVVVARDPGGDNA